MEFVRLRSLSNHDTGSRLPDHQLVSAMAPGCSPIVFIVDGDKAACGSLAPLMNSEGWHPETFTSAEEFLDHPPQLVPSCLILEVALPGLCGLELQKRVAAKLPHVPIVFLSSKFDVSTTVHAMKAGAVEFFTKPSGDEELLRAVRKALKRSARLLARETENQALKKCYASLTLRERQVMALVSSGLLNKQVGSELGISEITVKAHRGQVMRKMQAGSLADLVISAAKLGLAAGFEMPSFRRTPIAATSTVNDKLLARAASVNYAQPPCDSTQDGCQASLAAAPGSTSPVVESIQHHARTVAYTQRAS